jgi:hypothetical protein
MFTFSTFSILDSSYAAGAKIILNKLAACGSALKNSTMEAEANKIVHVEVAIKDAALKIMLFNQNFVKTYVKIFLGASFP